jgi:hypothetical protein
MSNPAAYSDMPSMGIEYKPNEAFETVLTDTDCQKKIPPMKSTTYNLTGDKSFSDVVKVDGYNDKMLPGEQAFRKQPNRIEHSVEDSRRISGYGVMDHMTKKPQYTGTASKGGSWTSPKANREIDHYAS